MIASCDASRSRPRIGVDHDSVAFAPDLVAIGPVWFSFEARSRSIATRDHDSSRLTIVIFRASQRFIATRDASN